MLFRKKTQIIQELNRSWAKPKEENFNFDLISRYFNKRQKSSVVHVVSEQTVNDINFRDVFAFVDRSTSVIGQQYLFSKLLTIEPTHDLESQEVLVEHFSNNQAQRLHAQYHLLKLSDIEAYDLAGLFLEGFENPPRHMSIIKLLAGISVSIALLSFVFHKLAFVLVALFGINMVIHYVNKKHTCKYATSIPRLSVLCSCMRRLIRLKLPSIPEDTVVLAVESIEPLQNRMKVFELEAKQVSDPFVGMAYLFLEYVKIQFLIEPILVFNVLKHLNEKRNEIRTLFDYCGRIDCAISIASLRAGLTNFCKPVISEENIGIRATNIYHPLVPNCVTNDISTGDRSILLTGSNMSGKSTFIRSISINTLFAQTINTCFATEFRIPPLRLYSTIRISDDVMNGRSYYFQEVLAIRKLVTASQNESSCLFCLDEIFKGTNTVERIAAAKAVLSRISMNGNIVFVSTHDIELAGLLSEKYDLYHFREDVEDGAVHFDFKLKPGFLKTRNAIRILQINGYPDDLIREAIHLSNRVAKYSERTNLLISKHEGDPS